MADSNSYGLFCVDPGRTTGIAKVLVNCSQPTVASTVRRAQRKGLLETHELKGEWYEQAWDIFTQFSDWQFNLSIERAVIPGPNVKLVLEGFTIRELGADITPLKIQTGIKQVMRAAMEGKRPPKISKTNVEYDRTVIVQGPSEQQFCSDEMLKDWGLWRKSPHERSALKHMAKRIDRILEGDR